MSHGPYLVVPEPYSVVCVREANHVIEEWLAFVVALGRGEYLCEELLEHL